ncbi:hypothetical protein K469DRAFT_619719 [Zopfia rhizophila CBS 207.26]|uniref:MARVEL domain-containing protein n=1 Tax=Zopfia rhizophila CBS 207.26 TaxID=1314779 RepID=A0A6A6ETB2_9PEZI|nr:hypothetical protein K469DRAFT_619719 [Zopfia rhizophila CBS 207.26]
MLRPAILANHFLHWASSVIVMSITAYFIAHFARNQHLIYWITVAAVDTLVYLPALFFPAVKSYKGYLCPLAWIFSYLWITAFIFAAQDYNWHNCRVNSPWNVNKCGLKKTLESFAFLAFFTNLVGLLLEWKLWENQRTKVARAVDGDKFAGPSGDTATTAATQPATAV